MVGYPRISKKDRSLVVEFVPGEKQRSERSLKMVLDFGEFGEIVGIEVINLVLQAGKNCLGIINQSVRTDGGELKCSYDEEADSFYLRLKAGRSIDQKAVQGSMVLDNNGHILALNAEW